MTNRVINAALLSLFLYVTASSVVHHHPVDGLAHQHCPACLWHSDAVADVPIISVVVPASLPLPLPAATEACLTSAVPGGGQQSRAPPVAAV